MSIYSEARPWGDFHVLDEGDGFKVKRIVVKPQGQLSLQSHKRRSEHWVVARGVATITIDDAVCDYKSGQYVFIPLGAKHRLENNDDQLLEVVEVQCGDYLGEDDIIRYEDSYFRV